MSLRRSFSNKLILIQSLFLIFISLSGCTNENNLQESFDTQSIGNPTPIDFLDDENADIFILENIVYSNAEDLEWVEDLSYTVGEQVGEIIEVTEEARSFGTLEQRSIKQTQQCLL